MKKLNIFFAILMSCLSIAFNRAEGQTAQTNIDANDIKTFQNTLLKRGIYFGSLINQADISLRPPRPQNYLNEISKYFNYYTLSYSWLAAEPKQQGVFDFSYTDKVVEFALAHNAKLMGHALVLGSSLPDWLTKGNYTPDQLKDILKTHVQTVVKHFKDKYPGAIIAWQVVNEPTCNNSQGESCLDYGVKKNIWTVIHRPGSNDPSDYMWYAFQWAHQADPNVKLYINENGIEIANNPKNDRVYNLVKHLKDEGAVINGLGIEGHLTLLYQNRYSADYLTNYMNRFADLGMETQITELDVMMSQGAKKFSNTEPAYQLAFSSADNTGFVPQAKLYQMFLRACLKARNCTGITTWGPWDGGSWTNLRWKGSFRPHLLDENLKPKLALKYMVDEMKGKPDNQ